MERVNFEILWTLNRDWDAYKIEEAFNNYLKELTAYIELLPVNKKVRVQIVSESYPKEIIPETIYHSWVRRESSSEEEIMLFIYKECGDFLPFLLLRELYRCFLHERIKDFTSVQWVVHNMVLEDADNLKQDHKKWKSFVDLHRQPLEEEEERIDKSFKRFHREVVQLFFNTVKENYATVQPEPERQKFASLLYQPIRDNTYLFLSNPDNVESIRVLELIYENEKYYRTKKDYEGYFESYKKAGKIKTRLTKSAFLKSLEGAENTTLSPIYKFSWDYFGAVVIQIWIKFHPLISETAALRILDKVKFIYLVRKNYTSLSHDYFVGAFLPTVYRSDYLNFFARLEDLGVILSYKSGISKEIGYSINFNWFKPTQDPDLFLNPKLQEYDEKNILRVHRITIHEVPLEGKFSLIDFVILDRMRHLSFSGRDIKQQNKQLITYKEDLQLHKDKILSLHSDLKKHFEDVINDNEIRLDFVDFVEKNKSHGFFYLLDLLNDIVLSCDAVEKSEDSVKKENSTKSFQDLFDRNIAFLQMRTNKLFVNEALRRFVRNTLIPTYFQSKKKDNLKTYFETKERYRKFRELLTSCLALQLFDLRKILKVVNDIKLYEKIYSAKDDKLSYYDELEINSITNEIIDNRLKKFLALDPPRLAPSFAGTIPIPSETFFDLIVSFTEENLKKFEDLSLYFRVVEYNVSVTEENLIFWFARTCYLTPRERYELACVLRGIFGKDILAIKFPRGATYLPVLTLRNYYDFPNKKYFYTKELFENYMLYAKKTIQNTFKPLREVSNDLWPKLLANKVSLESLFARVEKRVADDKIPCQESSLERLLLFVKNLDRNLLHPTDIKLDEEKFFTDYLKTIKFLPYFSKFGLSQYYLYFYPVDLNRIDFKLLLNNSFQSVKCSIGADFSPSFLVKYIFPYKNPNARYINRATRQYRIIREYCLFRITRAYFDFRFDRPYKSRNWNIDPDKFENLVQEVLFTDAEQETLVYLNECALDDSELEKICPDSKAFESLQSIYGRKAVNLKSKMFVKHSVQFENFTELLRNGLVCPYVKLRGLGLHEKIRFILPNISKKEIQPLLRVFKFFNHYQAYEIEGSLYVQGLEKEIVFDHGLFVKLYLPGYSTGSVEKEDSIGALIDVLISVFDVLKINHILILDSMVKLDGFFEHVFGDTEFLKNYNPLLNLRWNEKEKMFENNKLFDENHNPIYPELVNGKNNKLDSVTE